MFAAQALCGYETGARNASGFCQLFEQEEWLEFEYGACRPSFSYPFATWG